MAMNKTYIPALITTLLLSVLHRTASENHWYVRYYGVDVLMHILGGAALALAIYWILITCIPQWNLTFSKIVLLTLIAGVGWEFLEALNGIAGAPVGTLKYYIDTTKDFFSDAIGAVIAGYFLKK